MQVAIVVPRGEPAGDDDRYVSHTPAVERARRHFEDIREDDDIGRDEERVERRTARQRRVDEFYEVGVERSGHAFDVESLCELGDIGAAVTIDDHELPVAAGELGRQDRGTNLTGRFIGDDHDDVRIGCRPPFQTAISRSRIAEKGNLHPQSGHAEGFRGDEEEEHHGVRPVGCECQPPAEIHESGDESGRAENGDGSRVGSEPPRLRTGPTATRSTVGVMPTFDVVSEVAMQEVRNAVDQAAREIGQRFDFKGTESSIELTDDGIKMASSSEDRLAALRQVLEEKLVKRKVSMKVLDYGNIEAASGTAVRQTATLQAGISSEKAKELNKFIKGLGLKGVQSSTQGDQLRVNGKKRDDLQSAIAALKEGDFGIPLQFNNFRD